MRPTLAALALSVLAFAAQAQTADDPVNGKALFENTALASGNAGLPICTSCHGSVEARRSQLSGTGDSFADITFDTAMTRFTTALATQPDMRPLRVLTNQQVRNIAAYIADTPKTSPVSETQLNFSAALNGNSAAQTVTLKHATATIETLQIVSVAAIGAGASNFIVQPACNLVTLQPGGTCALTVTYSPTTSTASTPDLVFTMKQGASTTTFERVLFLNGSVTTDSGGGGGGALGLGWLAVLGAAVAALARRRRA
jgi:cytochrome c553